MAYGTATLTGTYKTFDDQPAEGVVEIIPNSRQLIDAEGDAILAGRVKATLTDGAFTVTLPATDDATVEPATGRQYTVVAKLRHTHLAAVTGVELTTGTTVDIADVSTQPEVDAEVTNAATTAQVAALEDKVASVFAVDADTYGDGVTDATAHIQGKIDAASTAGGGAVYFPPGEYLLSRSDDIGSLILPSNVTLRGAGPTSHLFLDPATPADAAKFYVLRLGTDTTGVENVTIEDLKLTANHAAIGGGSIIAIGALHDGNKDGTTSSNITVRRCHIYDSQQAFGVQKGGGDSQETTTARLDSQFSNLVVEDCVMDLCGNKMVEFGEVNGGRISRNRMTRCWEGPQVIFFSRNVTMDGNYVTFTGSGINVSAGSHDINLVGNTVEADPTISAGVATGALNIRTEPTTGRTYDCYNIRSKGNTYRDLYTSNKRVMKFNTRSQVASAIYRNITFENDIFDGTVYFAATEGASVTTVKEVLFSNCTIEVDFTTVASSTHAEYGDVELRGCRLRSGSGYTLNGNNFTVQNSRLKSALTIAAGVTGTIVHGNRVVGGVTDNGTGTSLANNVTG